MRLRRQRLLFNRTGGGAAVTVAIGTLIGQGAVLISSPILTRLYGPGVYGEYSVIIAIVGLFSTTSALHYELAITLPEDNERARHLAILGLVMVALTTTALTFLLCFLRVQIEDIVRITLNFKYISAIASALLLTGFGIVLSAWVVRHRDFDTLAKSKCAQGLLQGIAQSAFGFANPNLKSLVLGQMAGLVSNLWFLQRQNSSSRSLFGNPLAVKTFREVASRYKDFARYSTVSSFINAIALNTPTIFISAIHGPLIAGLYALSYRILQIPIRLIGQSVSQVFFPLAVSHHRDHTLPQRVLGLFGGLTAFAIPSFVVLAIVGPSLFNVAFGANWREGGYYASFLSPWMLALFITTSMSTLVSVLEQQKQEVRLQVLYVASTVIALCIAFYMESPRTTILLISIGSTVILAWKVRWLLRIAGVNIRAAGTILMREFVVFSPIYLLLAACAWYIADDIVILCCGFAALMGMHFLNYAYRGRYQSMLSETVA